MKKVAVILSGCGVFDGAEIHEAVLSLLAIRQHGGEYQCFAPDKKQMHVVNHLSGEEDTSHTRNVLTESARIARGEIKPVTELNVDEFDALIVPGGFGAAKNLCTFANDGADSKVDEQVAKACKLFAEKDKPAGYACIAPALAASIYGQGVKLTIGTDEATAEGINALGATHVNCPVEEIVIDSDAKLVTTPAYMLAQDILDAHTGINKMVQTVIGMA
ncbi:isoprenoid biosynthesis glyoxalase ElbB [Alteromonas sp. ASW11-130]|uniref:isoprenoid biosynthesis glyoxalase ElbB n=1 Tax=Alteromonas sp. ASW11-130 TaxID=3015775 RepID=UPI00224288A5|nr:isoprenoid biosynthesis glyoxalase ElbB [Alteromonas sp. ASW11-130]MCW8093465.1 isoprenoid biosynthesis glyoxalase ElbB [Alteromonas sp. ASW11-130]